jgi:hypothetical protein
MSGPSSRDNRRLIVRVLSQEVMRLLSDWARANGDDLIGVLVFTAVWTANVENLSPKPALRYTELNDIPPDSLRTPITLSELTDRLSLPRATVAVYVRDYLDNGWLKEVDGGLIVPSEVIARLDQMESLNTAYERAHIMMGRLLEAGLTLETPAQGDQATGKPKIGK